MHNKPYRCFSLFLIHLMGFCSSYCEKGVETEQMHEGAPLSPPEIVAARLVLLAGDGQTGQGGEALALPVVVQVVDSAGKPLEGIHLIPEIVEGGGRIGNDTTAHTDTEKFVHDTGGLRASVLYQCFRWEAEMELWSGPDEKRQKAIDEMRTVSYTHLRAHET